MCSSAGSLRRRRPQARAAARGSCAARPPPRVQAARAIGMPRRSIRRPRNTSGSTVSSSAAALRCSARKRWMRSRASGGTWGDSIAAVSPRTRSSLRRRASAITRARSTWRSSIGGACERAHDRGRIGGIDQQTHPGERVADLSTLEKAPRLLLTRRAFQRRPGDLRARHKSRIRGRSQSTGLRSIGGRR